MSAYSSELEDKSGNKVYPKTLEENVYDSNGNRLDLKVSSIEDDITQLNSDLVTKGNFEYVDVASCSTYPEIVTALRNNKTNIAYGSVGAQASSSNLRNLIGIPSASQNLSYMGAAIVAMGSLSANNNPVLLIFIYEQTNATYGERAKFKFVYPIGSTYNALPWITASGT